MKATAKLIAMLLFVLTLGNQAFAQDSYIVTRINGKVTNFKTGTQLKAGDVLQPSDRVTFDTFDSYIISISQTMGRFMMKMHEPPSPEVMQQLTVTVKDVAVPTKRRSLMAERYKPEQSEIGDLKGYFGSDKFSVIGNKVTIPSMYRITQLTKISLLFSTTGLITIPFQRKLGTKIILYWSKKINF